MSIRQQDIARHLGVSVGTVSQALRNAPQVSQEMRLEVQRAAVELGYTYRPREAVRTTVTNLAFVSWASPSNPFYSGVLQGVEQACRELEIVLRYSTLTDITPRALQHYADNDALLVAGIVDQQTVRQLKALGRPMILIDNNLQHLGLDRIEIENFGSLYRAVEQVAAWGHRRIAFLRWAGEGYSSFTNRLLGYRAAVTDLGLEPCEISCANEQLLEAGERGMNTWLDQHGAPNFTALVACNDEAAIGALHALHAHGLRVPHDVSVVGFDDIDLAQAVRPTLTTCHVQREQLGALAVHRLIERANDPDAPARALVLDTVLVERASTRRLR